MVRSYAILASAGLCALFAGGCRDVPQAPPERSPVESPFTTFLLDREFNVDYGAGFATPTVLIEGGTTVNVVYGDYNSEVLKYAGCPAYCGDSTAWRAPVTVDTQYGTGLDPSAALTATGLHIAYTYFPGGGSRRMLGYAFCPGACDHTRNWQRIGVDTGWYAQAPAIAADPNGGLHVIYSAIPPPFHAWSLRYAECLASCLDPANWQTADLKPLSGPLQYTWGGRGAAMTTNAAGRLQAVYASPADGGMRYATCASSCTTAANWQFATIEESLPYTFDSPSLARDGDGTLHVGYIASSHVGYGNLGEVRYAVCSSGCESDGGWARGVVAPRAYFSAEQSVVVATGGGRVWVAFIYLADSTRIADSTGIALAACPATCTDSARWQTTMVHNFGGYDPFLWPQAVGLGVDGNGKAFLPHVYWGAFYLTGMK